MPELPPLEIQALARIMDELDYYQILHLDQGASQSEVKSAYFSHQRTFHPDANRHLDADLAGHCARISKRVTEAYCVLRDPRRRSSYDAQLGEGDNRMQLAAARASHVRKESEDRQGKSPQGRQFYQRAVSALERDDAAAAVNALQMALTFEPGNATFKQKLAEAKALRS